MITRCPFRLEMWFPLNAVHQITNTQRTSCGTRIMSPLLIPIVRIPKIENRKQKTKNKYKTTNSKLTHKIAFISIPDVEVISQDTKFSHRREIRWKSIDESASGQYECRANVINGTTESKTWDLDVVQPQKPEVDSNFKSGGVSKKPVGEPIKLKCQYRGIPTPQLTWYKNGNEIRPEADDKHITLDENGTVLHLHYTKAEDEGKYKCVATNRIGSTSHETTLKMTGKLSIWNRYVNQNTAPPFLVSIILRENLY